MRLVIATPLARVVDIEDVVALRAEDATGAFGIRPGHADFLTILSISVVTWHLEDGTTGQAAVHGGVLGVSDGRHIEIATGEAVTGPSLGELAQTVLERFAASESTETAARLSSARLEIAAIRQIQRVFAARRGPIGSIGDGGAYVEVREPAP